MTLFASTALLRLQDWRKRAKSVVSSDSIFEALEPIAKEIDRLSKVQKSCLGPQRTHNIDGSPIDPAGSALQ